MNIGFIGAGKVGTVFGHYLKENGLNVVGYYSRNPESAQKAAEFSSAKVLSLEEVVEQSDIVFLTTPDSVIKKVCDDIGENIGFSNNQTIVHMSGALKSDILSKAKAQGANTFSLHPMQSFADTKKSIDAIHNTFFTMEGTGDKSAILEILKKIGNKFKEIEPEHKPLYHAAACVASNYLVTLAKVSTNMLKTIGFNEQEGHDVLMPLMQGTMDNIDKLGVVDALTGPIVRGDMVTIQNHLENLNDDQKSFYSALGLETLDVAEKRGLRKEDIEALKKILEGSGLNG
ncbi:DUF2520 domain-containing protein [Alkalicella caledoniensis]|uniref:DUF2520 domain-containing protein n=1 Tax=Alkalicella caledoniensis TaxID=2731377 RepID=A0A7G9W544_ALKCA|nr:Rossmann-like and DUF2520 domain-containing protein [Alkalicella caledoniensis]QNO13806.1 DUF2520 domain-containing protein [Alkalicella caledoniensis]